MHTEVSQGTYQETCVQTERVSNDTNWINVAQDVALQQVIVKKVMNIKVQYKVGGGGISWLAK